MSKAFVRVYKYVKTNKNKNIMEKDERRVESPMRLRKTCVGQVLASKPTFDISANEACDGE